MAWVWPSNIHQYNANNPKLVVETIVSREEILHHETVFRGLLQQTKDTITKAVKDNLPPEVGQEVTDLVLNVRPASSSAGHVMQKPQDSTIGAKVRQMLDADSKQEEDHQQQEETTKEKKEVKKDSESKSSANIAKPAQLTRNPSALSELDFTLDTSALTTEVVLQATNRPNTPKTSAKVDRKIGATKVAAVALAPSGKVSDM